MPPIFTGKTKIFILFLAITCFFILCVVHGFYFLQPGEEKGNL